MSYTSNRRAVVRNLQNLLVRRSQRMGQFLQGYCRKQMRGSSNKGTYYAGGVYTGKWKSRGSDRNRSRPGEFPHVDTGTLRSAIDYAVKREPGRVVLLFGVRRGTATADAEPYAIELEYGTSKMAPRPYLRPSVLRNKRKLINILQA